MAGPSIGIADRSLADQIHEHIRERIINGDIAPGTRLFERELSEELKVSRIPLRETLPRLAAEGFVTIQPRKGAVVTQLTIQDVEELFDVRVALESLAARSAARNAQGPLAGGLAAALARSERATADKNNRIITAANATLHEVIVAMADNDLLSRLMVPVTGRVRWLFRLTADRDAETQCEEHRELCAAILAGDEERAAELSAWHVDAGRVDSVAALRKVLPSER